MSETPKTTTLQRYSDAISKLELKDQIERANKITAPGTLHSMLSASAPEQLVHRFSTKLGEVSGLTHYEKGRVMMTHGPNFNAAAREKMENAIKDGDPLGYLGLARIMVAQHNIQSDTNAVINYVSAFDAGIETPEAHAELGIIFKRHKHEERAREQFNLAKQMSANPSVLRRRINGTVALIIGEKEKGISLLGKNAATGDFASIQTLLAHYYEVRDIPNMKACMEFAAKMGDLKQLYELGFINLQLGEYEEAEKNMVLAMKAGYPEALGALHKFYEDNGDHKKANKIIKEVLDSSHYPPLLLLRAARILSQQKKFPAAKKASMKAMEKLGVMDLIREFQASGNNGKRQQLMGKIENDVFPVIQELNLERETLAFLSQQTDLDLNK